MSVHTRETILSLLESNPRAVERAIVFLYREQTSEERASSTTRVANGRGFNGTHARYGSYCARWVLSGKELNGKHLEKCRRIARVYLGQLVRKANGNG